MFNRACCSMVLALAAVMAATPALAADQQAPPAVDRRPLVTAQDPIPTPEVEPVPAPEGAVERPTPPPPMPPPVNPPMAGEQPVLEVREEQVRENRLRWTLTGAAIGLAIGLLSDEPAKGAVIGGGIGFGLSFRF